MPLVQGGGVGGGGGEERGPRDQVYLEHCKKALGKRVKVASGPLPGSIAAAGELAPEHLGAEQREDAQEEEEED